MLGRGQQPLTPTITVDPYIILVGFNRLGLLAREYDSLAVIRSSNQPNDINIKSIRIGFGMVFYEGKSGLVFQ